MAEIPRQEAFPPGQVGLSGHGANPAVCQLGRWPDKRGCPGKRRKPRRGGLGALWRNGAP